jgi:hypothetical protein
MESVTKLTRSQGFFKTQNLKSCQSAKMDQNLPAKLICMILNFEFLWFRGRNWFFWSTGRASTYVQKSGPFWSILAGCLSKKVRYIRVFLWVRRRWCRANNRDVCIEPAKMHKAGLNQGSLEKLSQS